MTSQKRPHSYLFDMLPEGPHGFIEHLEVFVLWADLKGRMIGLVDTSVFLCS